MRDRDGTACLDCGRRWTGSAECHCAACHNHFGSPSAFERHQNGSRCLTPEEMQAPTKSGRPLLVLIERKFGPVWVTRRREDR